MSFLFGVDLRPCPWSSHDVIIAAIFLNISLDLCLLLRPKFLSFFHALDHWGSHSFAGKNFSLLRTLLMYVTQLNSLFPAHTNYAASFLSGNIYEV